MAMHPPAHVEVAFTLSQGMLFTGAPFYSQIRRVLRRSSSTQSVLPALADCSAVGCNIIACRFSWTCIYTTANEYSPS